jgi:hypothetical protein
MSSFTESGFHSNVYQHFKDDVSIFSVFKSILLENTIPTAFSEVILNNIISKDDKNKYLKLLRDVIQKFSSNITTAFTSSLADMFNKKKDDSISIDDELLLIQSKVVKLKKFREGLYTELVDAITSLNIPNYSIIVINLLSYEIDRYVFKYVLNCYERGKGIHSDNIFIESSWDDYEEFTKSDIRLISADVNYFLVGYTIYRRLINAMRNRYIRIPVELHKYVQAFLSYGFYNKEDIEIATKDSDLPTNFIKIREKFGGLAYATEAMFQFYEWCSWQFYHIMSLSNVVIFHRDNPPKRIKEMLLSSSTTKNLFNKIYDEAIKTMDENSNDILQTERARTFIFVFILSGMVNLQNKSIYSRVLADFIQKDSNIAGIRVAVSIASSSKTSNNIKISNKNIVTPDKDMDKVNDDEHEAGEHDGLPCRRNEDMIAMNIVTPDKEVSNDDDDDDNNGTNLEDFEEALKMMDDIELSIKKLSISTGDYTHSSHGTSIDSDDANLSPILSPV